MGHYKSFLCGYCDYAEKAIAVGRGKQAGSYLALFVCRHCKSVGSTWMDDIRDDDPFCSYCYDHDIQLLDSSAAELPCPKCDEPGQLLDAPGAWE